MFDVNWSPVESFCGKPSQTGEHTQPSSSQAMSSYFRRSFHVLQFQWVCKDYYRRAKSMTSSILGSPIISPPCQAVQLCRAADLLDHLVNKFTKILTRAGHLRHARDAVTFFLLVAVSRIAAAKNPVSGVAFYCKHGGVGGLVSGKFVQNAQRGKKRLAFRVIGRSHRKSRLRLQQLK